MFGNWTVDFTVVLVFLLIYNRNQDYSDAVVLFLSPKMSIREEKQMVMKADNKDLWYLRSLWVNSKSKIHKCPTMYFLLMKSSFHYVFNLWPE